MVEIDGVTRLVVPVPPVTIAPPEAAAYQSMVKPAPGAATEIVTAPVPHLAPFVAPVGAAGIGFTVAVTKVLVPDTQPVVVLLTSA